MADRVLELGCLREEVELDREAWGGSGQVSRHVEQTAHSNKLLPSSRSRRLLELKPCTARVTEWYVPRANHADPLSLEARVTLHHELTSTDKLNSLWQGCVSRLQFCLSPLRGSTYHRTPMYVGTTLLNASLPDETLTVAS